MLKAFLDTLDGLNPAIAAEYTKGDDGKFRINVEGMVDKKKAEEKLEAANQTNSRISQELADAKKQLGERPDPEDYKRTKSALEELKNGKGEDFKTLVGREVESYKKQAEAELAKAKELVATEKTSREKAEKALSSFHIDRVLTEAALESGLKKKALPTFLENARKDWEFREGKPVPMKDGAVMIGENLEPMTAKAYVGAKKNDWDYFFEQPSGGGAPGSKPPTSGPGNFRLSAEEARDPLKYRAVKAEAEKAGQAVQILE